MFRNTLDLFWLGDDERKWTVGKRGSFALMLLVGFVLGLPGMVAEVLTAVMPFVALAGFVVLFIALFTPLL